MKPAVMVRNGLAAVLALYLAGCSGLSPQKPVNPIDPNSACGEKLALFTPLNGSLASVGTDTTLDLATWNLEFFPLRLPGDFNSGHPIDNTRTVKTAEIINTLNLDVIAVQEISDPIGFQQLLDLCPSYDGVLSPESRGTNYQRVGLIYRKDQVTVTAWKLLFTNDRDAFPRSPLEVEMTIISNGRAYDLNVIVVHLKASGDAESQQRRRSAVFQMKNYLDQKAAADSTVDYVIAGDWNDALNDPANANVFLEFLNDPSDYDFSSMALVGVPFMASLGTVLIDHIMINRAACGDFNGGRVSTLRLDLINDLGYRNVSDHRPVMVQTPVFK